MRKIIRVKFSEEAENVYRYLNKCAISSKAERMIFNSLNKKEELLKTDYHYGDPISKKLIPLEYKLKYGIINLFRIELPLFWRMLYTVTDNENEIIVFVLDVIDHKKYNKKMGYRKK